MVVAEENRSYFVFLEKRAEFVERSVVEDSIEGYVVWGAAMDALTRIHARRVGRKIQPNRACFTQGLLELAPELSAVSIPLLAHELRSTAATNLTESRWLKSYSKAAGSSRIWSAKEDPEHGEFSGITTTKEELRLLERNRYCDILYGEFRCCAVHGLELGHKTFCSPDVRGMPAYMNYRYGTDDPRQAKDRVRTRLCFPLDYLADVLRKAIQVERDACIAVSFAIPAYPTLD